MNFLNPNILSPSIECARSEGQYRTVLQSLRSFPWMLDCEWTDCLLSNKKLKNVLNLPNETCAGQETIPSTKTIPKHQLKRESERLIQLSTMDYVPTKTHSSQGESQLYIFEDSEAKGRSPTMRHVNRTH